MENLSALTADTFEPLTGETFGHAGDGPALVLSCVARGRQVDGHREPFVLTFEGPRSAFLGQGMRRLQHGTLGDLEVFLVPVGMTEESYRYEAVFG